jgi:predicted HicB family RNase H-like nuclease
MSRQEPIHRKKTFPLEIEDGLHKALKVRAIELDKTLHSFIIETLSARVQEESATYGTKRTAGEKKK